MPTRLVQLSARSGSSRELPQPIAFAKPPPFSRIDSQALATSNPITLDVKYLDSAISWSPACQLDWCSCQLDERIGPGAASATRISETSTIFANRLAGSSHLESHHSRRQMTSFCHLLVASVPTRLVQLSARSGSGRELPQPIAFAKPPPFSRIDSQALATE